MTTLLFRRPRFAFLWIAFIPVALSAVAFWDSWQLQNEIAWISQSYTVRTVIRDTVLQASNAERELRTYLLTRQDSHLQSVKADAGRMLQSLGELRRLTADDPVQQRNIARLKPLVEVKIGEFHRIVNLNSTDAVNAELSPSAVDQSRRSMEEIRDVSRSMMQEEERLLLARTQMESRMGRQAEVIFASVILMTLVLLLWAGRLAKQYAAKRDRAAQALQQKMAEIETLNRELEQRVAERTAELQGSNQELARAYESSRLLASIVESSDDAIVGKSLDGIIQTWNAGADRLYGYKADEMLGHNISDLVPPDRLHEESGILEKLRNGERVDHFATVRLRKGGEPVDVSLTISPIREKDGRIAGASDVARDVTEQKRNAEIMRQAQKLESLGVLAGGIAHDFNNLLVGVLANASLALDKLDPDSPARAFMQEVIVAGERAALLSRQMLAYSGRGHFVLERIDLSRHVRETVPLIQAGISRTVELHLDLAQSLPAIEADASQVQQVVMNLVINGAEAVPAGKPGAVTVTTRLQQVEEQRVRTQLGTGTGEAKPGMYVMLEVRDTGSGMDNTMQARIFEPFFTTKFTGRGLGLAAVLGIVRGHSGSIEVSSTVGHGSVFRVLFPALAAPLDHKASQQQPDLSGVGAILVIDDDDLVRRVARQALEHYGYSVLLAEDGKRGLEVFRRNEDCIQCVVLDMTMPVMSGEATLSWMKLLYADIPVILSSGFSEAEAVPRFQGKGLAGFIQKPYKASELSKKVKDAIARAPVRHSPREHRPG